MRWDERNPFDIIEDLMDKLMGGGAKFGTNIMRGESINDTPYMDYQYDESTETLTITLDMSHFSEDINVDIKGTLLLIDATGIDGRMNEFKIDISRVINKPRDNRWKIQKTTDFISYNNGVLTIKVKIRDKRVDIYG